MIRSQLTCALAGGAVMALEILASRWLAPSVGFTLSTWAWLISITLLAGTLGAAWGGRLSTRTSWRRVGVLLLVSAVWVAGLAAAGSWLSGALLTVSVELGGALGALAILAVPVALLGAVLPQVLQLTTDAGARGRVAGRLVAASTAGSLIGTLGAAFWMVPHTGLQTGSLVLAALLAGAGGLLVMGRLPGAAAALGFGAAALLVGGAPAADGSVRRVTPYGELRIVRGALGAWHMEIDGVRQAGLAPLSRGPGALLRARQYVELLPYLHPGATTGLCIGLGGGQVSAMLARYEIDVHSVEINPVVVEVARERFRFTGPVEVGDGRAVWRRLDRRFDVIVLDAFQGESLPAHLVTREAFEELAARLGPGGVLCLHLIGRPTAPPTAAVARTLASVFPHLLAVRAGVDDGLQDLFLFASSAALVAPDAPDLRAAGWIGNEVFEIDTRDAPILTDDRNPIDVLNAPLAAALRAASRPR